MVDWLGRCQGFWANAGGGRGSHGNIMQTSNTSRFGKCQRVLIGGNIKGKERLNSKCKWPSKGFSYWDGVEGIFPKLKWIECKFVVSVVVVDRC